MFLGKSLLLFEIVMVHLKYLYILSLGMIEFLSGIIFTLISNFWIHFTPRIIYLKYIYIECMCVLHVC